MEGTKPPPPNTVASAILDATRLLEHDPAAAEERTLAILKANPGQAEALALLVGARRLANDVRGVRDLLQAMAQVTPRLANLQYELGKLQYELQEMAAATAAFSRVVELEPLHANAWQALAVALAKSGRAQEAAQAYAKLLELSVPEIQIREESARSGRSQLPAAETLLQEWLRTHPTDVVALHLLGTVYYRLSRHEEAEEQFSNVLKLAPDHAEARFRLAGTFVYRGDWDRALTTANSLLKNDPQNAHCLDLKAFALLRLGQFDAALAAYKALLSVKSTAENWKSYGQVLKALGRTEEAVAAYRKSIAQKTSYGMAYWCLAELKTFRFDATDIAAMERALQAKDIGARDVALIRFALGRAHEDAKRYEESFEQFRRANAAVRTFVRHNPDERAAFVRRNTAAFTPEYFRTRSDWGIPNTGPIFIVGLPRSGSTLIEQILASHSQVEACGELQMLELVIRKLSQDAQGQHRHYPEMMPNLTADQMRQAGTEYFERALPYRRLNRPFFIDKMPNNFSYLGMILTALPNSKIIDARRHPLGSGFAIFKHYFVDAYTFASDLADIGRYYRHYVELMAHFDHVQPGRVHRVFYEDMVAEPEREIRKLLDYCCLHFEESCLKFHESGRAVLTPSAEQVRQPIYAEATDLWRRYERWLAPLKATLGDVLDRYPEVPAFPYNTFPDQLGFSRRIGWSITAPPPDRAQT